MVKKMPKKYFDIMQDLLKSITATSRGGKKYQIDDAVNFSVRMIRRAKKLHGKIIFIGNGGSATIASHLVVDFLKNTGMQALAFNDEALLTCISNDFGYEYVFEKPIKIFAGADDVLVAISSSGQSRNILRGVAIAKKKRAGS